MTEATRAGPGEDRGARPGAASYRRDDAFSYQCRACGRCCRGKRIPLGAYDVLRLARHLGLTTGEVLRRHAERDGPWLRAADDGTCVFLDAGRCTVHADRPLACRVYPLGRWVTAQGGETFRELAPHPQSEGRYGREGTVAQFLERQGVAPYLEAADRYQALFYRLFDALQALLPGRPDLGDAVPATLSGAAAGNGDAAFVEWLDADRIATRYCQAHGLPVPDSVEAVMRVHVQAIDEWLNTTGGDTT